MSAYFKHWVYESYKHKSHLHSFQSKDKFFADPIVMVAILYDASFIGHNMYTIKYSLYDSIHK